MFLIVWEFIGDLEINGDLGDNKWKNIIKEFWELMKEKGYIHVKNLTDLTNLTNISVVISRGAHLKYTKEVLEKFPNLEKILLAQIGNDNVDLEYCKQKGIEVKNLFHKKAFIQLLNKQLLVWLCELDKWCLLELIWKI